VVGVASVYAYSCDAVGRLLPVEKDGTVVEQYGYDADGVRTSETNTLRSIGTKVSTYSNEDHLLTSGAVTLRGQHSTKF